LSFLLSKIATTFSETLKTWTQRLIKAGFLFLGAATVLEIWGVEVGPLLAGLGLFGVAVALGAQDLFKNLIAGLLIIAERRFNVGDWILVEGTVEGIVENVGFRSTSVRRFDKAPVYVPNAHLSDTAVTNFSRMSYRRIFWTIGVEYRTTIEQLRKIRDEIEEYVTGSDDFADPSEVATFVRIDRFSDSSIDIMLYCFTKTRVWGEWLEIKENLAYRVKEIVEGAGTGFAFPSQSVYVEQIPGETPELFVPPETGGAARLESRSSEHDG
jgi:MscS family membrane protein